MQLALLKIEVKIEVNNQEARQPSWGSALATNVGTTRGPVVPHEPRPTKK